jgi:RHH-type proline utilization regulon transcriptional repressor/proline dehydrogenase/delta 1-pyrroline-5-carboxylate dehydrogenase
MHTATASTLWQRLSHHHDWPSLPLQADASLQQVMGHVLSPLAQSLAAYRPSVMERASNAGLDMLTSLPCLQAPLLRFIALLPTLAFDRSGELLKTATLDLLTAIEAQAYLLPFWVKPFMAFNKWDVGITPAPMLAWGIHTGVKTMAQRFIVPDSPSHIRKQLKQLHATGRLATFDPLGELVVTPTEADTYLQRVLTLINTLHKQTKSFKGLVKGVPAAHISIKVTALTHDPNPADVEATLTTVGPRLRQILLAAQAKGVFINIDAEHIAYRDLVFELWRNVLLTTPQLATYAHTGIVVQGYLRDASQHLQAIIALAKERNLPVPVRLVKGAYWDAETTEALDHGHPAPQWLNKAETDAHFRQLILQGLAASPWLPLAIGSHNVADHAFAEAVRSTRYPEAPPIEHQCLRNTYEALSLAMAQQGWLVRDYVPLGNLLVGMAYLVRRVLENASQLGVLAASRQGTATANALISPTSLTLPQRSVANLEASQRNPDPQLMANVASPAEAFANTPPLRLYLADEKQTIDDALAAWQPLAEVVNQGFSGEIVEVTSPSSPKTVVGRIAEATLEEVSTCVATAYEQLKYGEFDASHPLPSGEGRVRDSQVMVLEGRPSPATAVAASPEGRGDDALLVREDGEGVLPWPSWPVEARSAVLGNAAQLLLAQRPALAVLISHEAGKALPEALADVDEAVDFLNFYARQAVSLAKTHRPVGVVGVIAPWNFPLAIPCGMTVGALAMGNPVILKSAKHTPLIAQKLVDILHEAGVPKAALHHVVGGGSSVGQALLDDERIAAYAFTGSCEVGMHLLRTGLKRWVTHPATGQRQPVRVTAEMGGKNALIVTANADVDEAVSVIVHSALGHAGQKCSALSRVVIDERLVPHVAPRLAQALQATAAGKATAWRTRLNPVATPADQKRLIGFAEKAVAEATEHGGRVWCDDSQAYHAPNNPDAPCLVGPVLVQLPAERATHPDSCAQAEAFGPIVHLLPYNGELEEAVRLANATPFALTAGIVSQSATEVDWLLPRLKAGNVYVNRNITGARVAIEPFGGFDHSGTGPKAGSVDYLKFFGFCPSYPLPSGEGRVRDGQVLVLEGRPSPAAPAAASPEGRGDDAPLVKTVEALHLLPHAEVGYAPQRHPQAEAQRQFIQKLAELANAHPSLASVLAEPHWQSFVSKLGDEGYALLSKGSANLPLKGQANRNRFLPALSRILVVASGAAPCALVLRHLLVAAWLHTPVGVLLTGEALAHAEAWQAVVAAFAPPESGVVVQGCLGDLPVLYQQTAWPLTVVQGDEATVQSVQQALAPAVGRWPSMGVVQSAFHGYGDDAVAVLSQHVRVQAEAINLMRHGALLADSE